MTKHGRGPPSTPCTGFLSEPRTSATSSSWAISRQSTRHTRLLRVQHTRPPCHTTELRCPSPVGRHPWNPRSLRISEEADALLSLSGASSTARLRSRSRPWHYRHRRYRQAPNPAAPWHYRATRRAPNSLRDGCFVGKIPPVSLPRLKSMHNLTFRFVQRIRPTLDSDLDRGGNRLDS